MIKLYMRDDDGALHYREAWTENGGVHTHHGKVGTRGKSRFHPTRSRTWPDKQTAADFLRTFREHAEDDGFHEVPGPDHGWLVLQCWTCSPDFSHPDDRRLLDEGQEALDQHLGWHGVGHVDGNDIGGTPPDAYDLAGTVLNLFCRVVDTTVGVKVVRSFARQFQLTPYHVIGTREAGDSPYVLAWSARKRDTGLQLF